MINDKFQIRLHFIRWSISMLHTAMKEPMSEYQWRQLEVLVDDLETQQRLLSRAIHLHKNPYRLQYVKPAMRLLNPAKNG